MQLLDVKTERLAYHSCRVLFGEEMRAKFRHWVQLLVFWMVLPAIMICQTPRAPQQTFPRTPQPMNRHARRIRRTLSRISPRAQIAIQLRDHSTRFGDLGSLSPTSFELIDRQTQAPTTYSYAEIAHVYTNVRHSPNNISSRHHRQVPVMSNSQLSSYHWRCC